MRTEKFGEVIRFQPSIRTIPIVEPDWRKVYRISILVSPLCILNGECFAEVRAMRYRSHKNEEFVRKNNHNNSKML
jgi:hypothetical protein